MALNGIPNPIDFKYFSMAFKSFFARIRQQCPLIYSYPGEINTA